MPGGVFYFTDHVFAQVATENAKLREITLELKYPLLGYFLIFALRFGCTHLYFCSYGWTGHSCTY